MINKLIGVATLFAAGAILSGATPTLGVHSITPKGNDPGQVFGWCGHRCGWGGGGRCGRRCASGGGRCGRRCASGGGRCGRRCGSGGGRCAHHVG